MVILITLISRNYRISQKSTKMGNWLWKHIMKINNKIHFTFARGMALLHW